MTEKTEDAKAGLTVAAIFFILMVAALACGFRPVGMSFGYLCGVALGVVISEWFGWKERPHCKSNAL